MRDYIVEILNKKTKLNVRVRANSKAKAVQEIEKLLIRCKFFGYSSLKDFKIECSKN